MINRSEFIYERGKNMEGEGRYSPIIKQETTELC
jgi:hypothetical protein